MINFYQKENSSDCSSEEDFIEIVIEEGEKHPFCPRRLPTCGRDCRHFDKDIMTCSLIFLHEILEGKIDPESLTPPEKEFYDEIQMVETMMVNSTINSRPLGHA